MCILYKTIEELCERKGITGYKLCKEIGMSPNVITELRLGRRNGVSTKNIQKIANYFGVTVGYLLGEEEKENNPVETDELKLLIDSLSEKKREQLVQYAKFLASQKD